MQTHKCLQCNILQNHPGDKKEHTMKNRKYFELNNKNTVFKSLLFVMKRKLIALNAYNRKEERQKQSMLYLRILRCCKNLIEKRVLGKKRHRNMFTIFLLLITSYYFLVLLTPYHH